MSYPLVAGKENWTDVYGQEREKQGMIEARRSMYLCWIVALCGVLAFLLWTQFIWHLLLAIMVVQVMVK